MRCSIFGCKSSRLDCRVSLHALYREGKFNEEWVEAIRSLNGQSVDVSKPSKSFVVCAMHFEKKFQLNYGAKCYLKPGAIPTIFPRMLKEAEDKIVTADSRLKEIENDGIDISLSNCNFEQESSFGVNVLADRANTDLKCKSISLSKDNVFVEKTQPIQNFDIDPATTTRMKSNNDDIMNTNKDNDLQSVANRSQISQRIQELPRSRSHNQCGVPQCPTRRNLNGISMFQIPNDIRSSPVLLRKWSKILRMEKPFSKYFVICSLHFEKDQIIFHLKRGDKEMHPQLVQNAVPSLNLPKPKNVGKHISKQFLERAVCVVRRRRPCEIKAKDPLGDDSENDTNSCTKSIQVNLNPCVLLSSFCDTDKKLNAWTGLDDKLSLDNLVKESFKLRKTEDVHMAMSDRIILTMCKLKTNLDFEQLAVLFQLSNKITENYFADTIKHLAKILRPLIYWPSKEKFIKSLPQTFKYFPNVRIVVESFEINIYPRLKFLIGFAPSGSIIYVSKMFSGSISKKDMFLQTDLLQLLNPNDAAMIDKVFLIKDALSNCRIEMVTHDENRIAAAKALIEKQIEKLKKFKVLSETVDASLTPFINDIVVVLCGLSNMNSNKNFM